MDLQLFQRHLYVNDDNFGLVVNIVSIVLLVLVILAVLSRLATWLFSREKFGLEHAFVFTAALLSVGELVSVIVQVANGLGSPFSSLNQSQIDIFQKTTYASKILYMLNLNFTEVSVLLMIRSLTPVVGHRSMILNVLYFVGVWTFISLFVLLFQCQPPLVWQFIGNEHCINRIAYWEAFTVLNVLIELTLIILPVALVWNVKIQRGKKWIIILTFALRILVIIPSITQLAYLIPTATSNNITLSLWPSVLCAQFTQTLGIVTACALRLKPFFMSLESGMLRTDDERRRRRQGSRSGQGASGYVSLSNSRGNVSQSKGRSPSNASQFRFTSQNRSTSGRDFRKGSQGGDAIMEEGNDYGVSRPKPSQGKSMAWGGGKGGNGDGDVWRDNVPMTTRSESRQGGGGGIQQTRSVTIEYSDRRDEGRHY